MSNHLRFSIPAVSMFIGVGIGILAFGCSVDTSAVTSDPDERATGSMDAKFTGVTKVALKSELPNCNVGHQSSVYYVESTEDFTQSSVGVLTTRVNRHHRLDYSAKTPTAKAIYTIWRGEILGSVFP